MKDISWDDLRLFFHVARQGGLTGAAIETGWSAPTIGRRMLALEKALGRSLFVRKQTGYTLAPDGLVLFERAKTMVHASQSIEEWREGVLELPMVRFSANAFLSSFMARHLKTLWTPTDGFRLCFKTAETEADFDHRETDIAISDERPATGNIAARSSVRIAFAPYCARDFDQERNCNWIALGTSVAATQAAKWTSDQKDLWITLWAENPKIMLDLVRGGAGRSILPCFIGDDDPLLVRAGEQVEELEHQTFILMHDEERNRPEVRTMIDRIALLLESHAALFAGRLQRNSPG